MCLWEYVTYDLERIQAAMHLRTDREGVVFVWEMHMFTQKEHTDLKTCLVHTKPKHCPKVKIDQHLPKEGGNCERLLVRWGPRLRTTSKGEAKSDSRWRPLVIDQ